MNINDIIVKLNCSCFCKTLLKW